MNATKWTAGPWTVTYSDGSDNGRYVVGPNDDQPQDRLIADCYADSALDLGLPSLKEMRANARLIAAAPEMYAALMDAHTLLLALRTKVSDADAPLINNWIAAARAALAKARGEAARVSLRAQTESGGQ